MSAFLEKIDKRKIRLELCISMKAIGVPVKKRQ